MNVDYRSIQTIYARESHSATDFITKIKDIDSSPILDLICDRRSLMTDSASAASRSRFSSDTRSSPRATIRSSLRLAASVQFSKKNTVYHFKLFQLRV